MTHATWSFTYAFSYISCLLWDTVLLLGDFRTTYTYNVSIENKYKLVEKRKLRNNTSTHNEHRYYLRVLYRYLIEKKNKHLRMKRKPGGCVCILKFKSFITFKYNICICKINPPGRGIDLHEFFNEPPHVIFNLRDGFSRLFITRWILFSVVLFKLRDEFTNCKICLCHNSFNRVMSVNVE